MPARVCLAGEDLDWLGGGAVQLAIDKTLRYSSSWDYEPERFAISAHGTLDGMLEVPDVWSVPRASWASMCASFTAAHVDPDRNLLPSRVEIFSEIPPASGLASSAALAGAVASALTTGMDSDSLIEHCAHLERSLAGRDVGPMDFVPCVLGGITWCECVDNHLASWKRLTWPRDLKLVVIDTLQQRDTSLVIEWKRSRFDSGDANIQNYISGAQEIVDEMKHVLEESSPQADLVGDLVSRAHAAMRDDLMVSTPIIEACVDAMVANGSIGAKITGTGLGGCVVGLVFPDAECAVLESVGHLPVRSFVADMSVDGAKVED